MNLMEYCKSHVGNSNDAKEKRLETFKHIGVSKSLKKSRDIFLVRSFILSKMRTLLKMHTLHL